MEAEENASGSEVLDAINFIISNRTPVHLRANGSKPMLSRIIKAQERDGVYYLLFARPESMVCAAHKINSAVYELSGQPPCGFPIKIIKESDKLLGALMPNRIFQVEQQSMYTKYFGLTEPPFSIAPDPHYLYMSQSHREAFAHLLYGVKNDGGFVLLTGEVGTGKTTVCRCLLEQLPDNTDVAFVLNPKVTAPELLATICDEFEIDYPEGSESAKLFVDRINSYLLKLHAEGRQAVLIIDEAQNLAPDVLEQIRLLTNLETNKRKLLQIIMLGQPELQELLAKPELRQLSQRITARYHLGPLGKDEIESYVHHRLAIAGMKGRLFNSACLKKMYKMTGGVPRLINLICDRALLGTYVQNKEQVEVATLVQAAREVLGETKNSSKAKILKLGWAVTGLIVSLALAGTAAYYFSSEQRNHELSVNAEMIQEKGSMVIKASDMAMEKPVSDVIQPVAENPGNEDFVVEKPVAEDSVAEDSVTKESVIIKPWPEQTEFASTNNEAAASILALWGLSYDPSQDGAACNYAYAQGLECVYRQDSFEKLKKLNRPAVLTFRAEDGEEYYAALKSIADSFVTLILPGHEFKIHERELAIRWSGFFTLLWRPPAGYEESIGPGDQGEIVEWLAGQLAAVNNSPLSLPPKNIYDAEFMQQVKEFQYKEGLVPDGIAGMETLIYLKNKGKESDSPLLVDDQR